jgi:hypothetical protein
VRSRNRRNRPWVGTAGGVGLLDMALENRIGVFVMRNRVGINPDGVSGESGAKRRHFEAENKTEEPSWGADSRGGSGMRSTA